MATTSSTSAGDRFGNRVLPQVLEQLTLWSEAERLRFSSMAGRESRARHNELIRLCAKRDTEGAAAVALETWHSALTVKDKEGAPAELSPHGE